MKEARSPAVFKSKTKNRFCRVANFQNIYRASEFYKINLLIFDGNPSDTFKPWEKTIKITKIIRNKFSD